MTDTGSRLAPAAADLLVALRDLAGHGDDAAHSLVAATERLQPRLASPPSPLLVVMAGSTGVGTSTLVNSLVGRRVSRSGALRPTTEVPVLVHHPDDHEQAASLLTRLPDRTEVAVDAAVPRGLSLLDSPALESSQPGGAAGAASLVETADLWVAVTSASRYADAAFWNHLTRAAARHATTAVVLNRVPALAVGEVSTHLAMLLSRVGLADSPLVVVGDHPAPDGLLPAESVAGLRGVLTMLGENEHSRALVHRSALSGAVADLLDRVEAVLAHGVGGLERDRVRGAATSLHAAKVAELA